MRKATRAAAGFISLPLTLGVFLLSFQLIHLVEAQLAFNACVNTEQLNHPGTTTAQARRHCAQKMY